MTFRKRALYVNYLKIYYSYYVYTMKKYTYCFGCDGKFGGSDGIASARRSSYFDLADDPEVSSEDLSAIEHFYAWNRKPLTTPRKRCKLEMHLHTVRKGMYHLSD